MRWAGGRRESAREGAQGAEGASGGEGRGREGGAERGNEKAGAASKRAR